MSAPQSILEALRRRQQEELAAMRANPALADINRREVEEMTPSPADIGRSQDADLRRAAIADVNESNRFAPTAPAEAPAGPTFAPRTPGLLERFAPRSVVEGVESLQEFVREPAKPFFDQLQGDIARIPEMRTSPPEGPRIPAHGFTPASTQPFFEQESVDMAAPVRSGAGLMASFARELSRPVEPQTGMPNVDIAGFGAAAGGVPEDLLKQFRRTRESLSGTRPLQPNPTVPDNLQEILDQGGVLQGFKRKAVDAAPGEADISEAARQLSRAGHEARQLERPVDRALAGGSMTFDEAEVMQRWLEPFVERGKTSISREAREGLELLASDPERIAKITPGQKLSRPEVMAATAKTQLNATRTVKLQDQIDSLPPGSPERTIAQQQIKVLEDESMRLLAATNPRSREAALELNLNKYIFRATDPDGLVRKAEETARRRSPTGALPNKQRTDIRTAGARLKEAERKVQSLEDSALPDLPGMKAYRARLRQLTADSATKVSRGIKSRIKTLERELKKRESIAQVDNAAGHNIIDEFDTRLTPEERDLINADPVVQELMGMVTGLRDQQRPQRIEDFASMFRKRRKAALASARKRTVELEEQIANGGIAPPEKELTKRVRKALDDDPEVKAARLERDRAADELARIANRRDLGLMDSLTQVYTGNLLTGPSTHITNIKSNMVNMPRLATVQNARALAEWVVEAGGGPARTTSFTNLRQLRATHRGAVAGAGESFRVLTDALPEGLRDRGVLGRIRQLSADSPMQDVFAKIDGGFGESKTVFPEPLDTLLSMPFRMLAAGDRPFYGAAQVSALDNMAQQIARNEVRARGLKGQAAKDAMRVSYEELLTNPTMEMMNRSQEAALYATFQDTDRFVQAYQGMIRGLQPVDTDNLLVKGVKGSTRLGLRMFQPFIRTPVALAKNVAEMLTPAGLLEGVSTGSGNAANTATTIVDTARQRALQRGALEETIEQVLAKDPRSTAIITNALANNAVGAGMVGLGYMLYKEGVAEPPAFDRGERDVAEAAGVQPSSFRIGDVTIDVSRDAPNGMFLAAGMKLAEVNERLAQAESTGLEALASQGTTVVRTVGEEFLNSPFIQGPHKFEQGLRSLSGDNALQAGQKMAAAQLRSVSPSILGGMARASDDVRRDTRSEDHPLLAPLMERTAGVRERLQPQVDTFGDEVRAGGGGGAGARALEAFAPVRIADDDPLKRRARELGAQVNKPVRPKDRYTDAEWTVYQQFVGKTAAEFTRRNFGIVPEKLPTQILRAGGLVKSDTPPEIVERATLEVMMEHVRRRINERLRPRDEGQLTLPGPDLWKNEKTRDLILQDTQRILAQDVAENPREPTASGLNQTLEKNILKRIVKLQGGDPKRVDALYGERR